MDNVFPNVIEESINVRHSKQQKWFYLDRQVDYEAIIFQGGDSKIGVKPVRKHSPLIQRSCILTRPLSRRTALLSQGCAERR